MPLSFPPQLTGDNTRDIVALQSYLYDIIDQFDNAVGAAIDASFTDGVEGIGGDGALTITEAPTDIVYTASSSLSVDETLFGAIEITYTLPDRAVGVLIQYREQGETTFKTSVGGTSPERLVNLKPGTPYSIRLAGRASNGSVGPFSTLETVTIPTTDTVLKAPADAEYLTALGNIKLTDARVVTDTATVAWDFSTDNSAEAEVPDLAITTAKLAALAVTTAKLADDAVTTAKVLNDAITTAKILNDAITTAKIVNDAVTYAKLQNVSAAARLLGRGSTAGAGDAQEITTGATVLVGTALLLDCGVYTPTATAVTNLDSVTTNTAHWLRIGTTVIVSGFITVDPTALGAVAYRLSLPVASAFNGATDCAGTTCAYTIANQTGAITADSTNDAAQALFIATSTASITMTYIYLYRVL